ADGKTKHRTHGIQSERQLMHLLCERHVGNQGRLALVAPGKSLTKPPGRKRRSGCLSFTESKFPFGKRKASMLKALMRAAMPARPHRTNRLGQGPCYFPQLSREFRRMVPI